MLWPISYRTLLCLLLFFVPAGSFSQNSFIVSNIYTTQNGLPHSSVYGSMQDSRGYLWVGTYRGICRFDGNRFLNYTADDSIPNLTISCTLEDEAGRIWIYSGWSVYAVDHNNIYPAFSGKPVSLNLVYRNADMKKLEWWAYTEQGRSFRVGNERTQDIPAPRGIGAGYCRRIVETAKGYYHSDTTGVFFTENTGRRINISQLVPRSSFSVIMGYWGEKLYFYTKNGVYTYDGSGIRSLFEKQLSGKRVTTSFRDSRNRIWVSTREDGAFVSKPNEEGILDAKLDLPTNIVNSFYEDREGNTWAALGEGLAKIQETKYDLFPSREYGYLSDMNIIAADRSNTMLLFSETNGMVRRKDGKFLYESNNPFKHHLVDALCFDEYDRAWCVTRFYKLLVYDGNRVTDLTGKITAMNNRDVYLDIAYDHYRKKVFTGADSLMIADKDEIRVFRSPGGEPIIDPMLILPLNNGKIVVLTLSNRLLVINKENRINKLSTSGSMLPERIHKLFTDAAGNIWISYTGVGLLQCRIENDSNLVILNKFTRQNGLENETIKSVTFDKQSRLWLATMTGISIINLPSGTHGQNIPFFNLNVYDGLPASGLEYSRLICDSRGDIWYMSLHALMRFRANNMELNSAPPLINIESVRLNDQRTEWLKYTDSLSGLFRIPYQPRLKYSENTIIISFKALSMNSNGEYQYSYMLKGLENDWSINSSLNSIMFTKLSPGTYTFLVKAKKTNSEWGDPASFTFTILPALWQHWWFNPMLVLIFLGFIYWLYRFRVKQIRKEEQVRRRLASDLHDDIGSTLSSISYYSEAIRKQVKDARPEVIPLLDEMEKASGNTVDAMSDIVWAINPELDKGTNLISRMHSYAAEMTGLRNIQLEFLADPAFEKLKLGMDLKKNVYLVFKEAVNNAVKYSGCSQIRVRLTTTGSTFEMEIADDGKGFDAGHEFNGNGLKNMQLRAREIKADFEIRSAPNQGCSVILKL